MNNQATPKPNQFLRLWWLWCLLAPCLFLGLPLMLAGISDYYSKPTETNPHMFIQSVTCLFYYGLLPGVLLAVAVAMIRSMASYVKKS